MASAPIEIRSAAGDSGVTAAFADCPRTIVRCECGHALFDGLVIKSRVIRVLPNGHGEALCRCKRWKMVPMVYSTEPTRRAGER